MAKNPYTMLFGKEPKQVISRFSESSVIIDNFCEEEFSEQMYIITGVRGSGKTVFMSEIANELEHRKEWITVELNSESELLKDLASKLSSENSLAEIFKNANINLSFFGFGLEVSGAAPITNIETAVTKMLESIQKHKKRLLITIDEVVNSKHMSEFAGAFQIFIRKNLPVFLLMTGLYQNIDKLQNRRNLTSLLRAPKIILKPLNMRRMAENYMNTLKVPEDDAINMARLTKGYSFAFQALGYMTYEKNGDYKSAISDYKHQLEDFVYDKIWSELSIKDREFLIAIAQSGTGKVIDIRNILGITNNQFNPYKKRLEKKGLIDGSYGLAELALPMFEEYLLDKVE